MRGGSLRQGGRAQSPLPPLEELSPSTARDPLLASLSQHRGSGSGRSHPTWGHCSWPPSLSGWGWRTQWAGTVAHSNRLWTLQVGWGRGSSASSSFARKVPGRRLGQGEGKELRGERRLPVWDKEMGGEPMSLTPFGPVTPPIQLNPEVVS